MKTITCDVCSKNLVGEKTFYEVNQSEKTFAIFSESEGYMQKKILKHMDICNDCFGQMLFLLNETHAREKQPTEEKSEL